jgi:hypothetical protein
VKRRCDGFTAYYRLKRGTGTSRCAGEWKMETLLEINIFFIPLDKI